MITAIGKGLFALGAMVLFVFALLRPRPKGCRNFSYKPPFRERECISCGRTDFRQRCDSKGWGEWETVRDGDGSCDK